jgi:transposase
VDDRAALGGIIFVLETAIPWELLPEEMGCGSGSTCWRRLRNWQQAGVWRCLHRASLDRLGRADRIDWSKACPGLGGRSGQKRVQQVGKTPTDHGKPGQRS